MRVTVVVEGGWGVSSSFTEALMPPSLRPPPPRPSRALQVVRLGFDRAKLVESIRTRQQNEATVTYWLLLDNR